MRLPPLAPVSVRVSRPLWALVALISIVGCSDESVPAVGSAEDASQKVDVVADVPLAGTDGAGDVGAAVDDAGADSVALDVVLDAGAAGCGKHGDCAAPTPLCDLAAGKCVACLLGAHCDTPGEVCTLHKCGPPTTCASDKVCLEQGLVCDAKAGACVDCVSQDDCEDGRACIAGHCLKAPTPCKSSKDCDSGKVCDKDAGFCADCAGDEDCTATQYCQYGLCLPDACAPGDAVCASPTAQQICKDNGSATVVVDCPPEQACQDGKCLPKICKPGAKVCQGNALTVCDARGVALVDPVPCPAGQSCAQGQCLPQICTPGATKCGADKDGKPTLLSCAPDGLSWPATPCGDGTGGAPPQSCKPGQDDKPATCVNQVCKPGLKGCQGAKATVCADDGLDKKVTVDCADLGGDAKVCVQGQCLAATCKAGELSCAGGDTAKCKAGGDGWEVLGCAAGQTCAAGKCVAIQCVPKELYCDGTSVKLCNGSGDGAALKTDCAAAGQTCQLGKCVPQVCVPGKAICGQDGKTVSVCKADGLGAVDLPCGPKETCVAGKCAAVVCAAGQSYCDGNQVKQCDATGTIAKLLQDCGAGKGCLKGACVAKVCTAGTTQCDKTGKLGVCAADGLSWGLSDCPASTKCVGTQCKAVVCKAAEIGCEGNKTTKCDATTTGWDVVFDCTKSASYCVAGVCKNKLCEAGKKSCQGASVAVCKADGLGWDAQPCTDGNLCTTDGCLNGACSFGKVKDCGDGNLCTTDGCETSTGKCTHTPTTGACDDGTQCTSGDTCQAGVCKASPWGTVSTVAGSGQASYLDGSAQTARFYEPQGLALGKGGEIYVADRRNHRIRKIVAGTVSVLAGSGSSSFLDGPAASARFYYPAGVAVQASGDVVVADTYNHRIRRISTAGMVTTVAGNNAGFADGMGSAARFYHPHGIAAGPGGVLLVADTENHRVRRIDANGKVTTLAGANGGFADGQGSAARFNRPSDIALDAAGVAWVADRSNHRVRRVAPDGTVTTLAGGSNGFQDGQGAAARFYYPSGIAVRADGALVVADQNNHRIRLISPGGLVSTLAGTASGSYKDGAANVANFRNPWGVAIDLQGRVVVGDTINHRIRLITPATVDCNDGQGCTLDTCDPKTGACSHTPIQVGGKCDDGNGCTLGEVCTAQATCVGAPKNCGDGNQCTEDLCDPVSGKCSNPQHALGCEDGSACTTGDVCEGGKCQGGKGMLSTIAGGLPQGQVDGSLADARFYAPNAVVEVPGKGLFVADTANQRIRRIVEGKDGAVSTWAGKGGTGYQDGPPEIALFHNPVSLVAGKGGALYVAETGNQRIRRVGPGGTVSTFAGDGTAGYLDGSAQNARFSSPHGMAIDGQGRIVLADMSNHRVRAISQDGKVSTVAGSGQGGYQDGPGTSAKFNSPSAVAFDGKGNILVVDRNNYRVRKIDANGVVSTLAGSTSGFQDGPASSARFHTMYGIAVRSNGIVVVADQGSHRLRAIDPAGQVTTLAGTGKAEDTEGAVNLASLFYPRGLAIDQQGSLLVTTSGGHSVRRLAMGAPTCDDGQPCTADSCDPKSGKCAHAPAKAGTKCDDGTACTSGEACDAGGKCQAAAKNCSDGNQCTLDSCNPYTAVCEHEAISMGCDDGDACTLGEGCWGGKCTVDLKELATLAGDGTGGFLDGAAAKASFYAPYGVAADAAGAVYVADLANARIRRIGTDGVVSTLAGDGTKGYIDGPGDKARLYSPYALDVHGKTLVVVDTSISAIRAIDTATGAVSTLAGHQSAGYVDGAGWQARFSSPNGLDVDRFGHIWVADTNNNRIRHVTPAGHVSTVAGSGTKGSVDGPAASATFNNPRDVALDDLGQIWVIGVGHRLRRIDTQGVVTTVAGSSAGFADGKGADAKFNAPRGLAFDSFGVLWIADGNNQRVRRFYPTGLKAGTVDTALGQTSGYQDGTGIFALMSTPTDLAFDPAGNLLIADAGNHRIRRVATRHMLCDDAKACTADSCDVKTGKCAFKPLGAGAKCDDGDACTLNTTCDQAGTCKGTAKSCSDGNTCTADLCMPHTGKCKSHEVAGPCDDGKACTQGERCHMGQCLGADGLVETWVGTQAGFNDGPRHFALLNGPGSLALDAAGRLWIGDFNNHRVRRLEADGTVITAVGTGTAGYVDGPGDKAQVSGPRALAVSKAGEVFFYDTNNHRVRKIDPKGVVSTVAGAGQAGFQDGPGSSARFNTVMGMQVLPTGGVLAADRYNHRIRLISPTGQVSTWAGTGTPGYLDGQAAQAHFNQPLDLALGPDGALYVVESGNHRVRRISPAGVVSTLAGSGTAGYLDGAGASAQFSTPASVGVDAAGTVFVGDVSNHRIRRIDLQGVVSTLAGAGAAGSNDGPGSSATFNSPYGLAIEPAGHLWIGDSSTHLIRRINSPSVLCADGNPCTANACDPASGKCKATALSDGSPCADPNAPCVEGQTCKAAKCQGGQPKACDDKNTCTLDSCEAKSGLCVHTPKAGCKAVRRAFISSAVWNGDLGGYLGADAKCQGLADAGQLGGVWMAWISTSASSPSSRFDKSKAAYVRMDGQQIAKDWSDLTDGSLSVPIGLDEKGKVPAGGTAICGVSSALAMTNTQPNGSAVSTSNSYSCNQWTSNTSSSSYRYVRLGDLGKTDGNWTYWACSYFRCNQDHHLYCFEQTDHFVPN